MDLKNKFEEMRKLYGSHGAAGQELGYSDASAYSRARRQALSGEADFPAHKLRLMDFLLREGKRCVTAKAS